MFKKHRHQKSHYFSKHPSRGLKDLYISVGLKDFALAAVTIFEPIFLFTLGYNLKDIAFYYLIIYGVYFLLLPFFGGLVGRIGLERSIFFSQFILILYFILLFSISNYEVLFYIAPLVAAIYKALYWPAYHTDFVIFSKDKQRGREVGGLETLSMIVYIIGPLVGGAVLEWANFGVLFIGVSILFILSSLPLLKIKEIHGRMVYSYWQSFRHFLDKQHRRNFLAYLGFGEELIVLTMWPIFIFMVVGDYLEIGALVAMATLVTSIVVLFLGKAADKYKRENILRAGTLIYFITWFFRGLATKAWHVFGLDASSRFSKEMLFVPLEVITYNTAKQVGTLSYVVFFEQSLAIAKCLAALLIMIIVSFFTSPWVP
ncbi:MFS transporter, partial [Patescibacteria group bacterium]|nr:MFS transporter [Patescibacteria group bacterium]